MLWSRRGRWKGNVSVGFSSETWRQLRHNDGSGEIFKLLIEILTVEPKVGIVGLVVVAL